MTTFSAAVIATFVTLIGIVSPPLPVHGLGGSASTVAVSYGSAVTVCSIVARQPTQRIQCWRGNSTQVISVYDGVSFDSIAGGRDVFCGIRSGGFSLVCWNSDFTPKRLYFNESVLLQDLTIGDNQICSLTNGTGDVRCWRGNSISSQSARFRSISSGLGFSCGILINNSRIMCWGGSNSAGVIETQFANVTMSTIFVGGSHACGLNTTGFLVCRGSNDGGQLDFPSNSAYEYSGLALGANHTCAIRRLNGTVVCWGGAGRFPTNVPGEIQFESIVAGLDFTCGLTTGNFSVICWGPGFYNGSSSLLPLPLGTTLPGPCVQSNCTCGMFPDSLSLCSVNRRICRPCDTQSPTSPPPAAPLPTPPDNPSPSSPSRPLRRGLLAFAIVGSVGAFAGICSIIHCLWIGGCFGNKRIHNSVQPTINGSNGGGPHPPSSSSPPSRTSTLRRQGSRLMRRQRSGTSSLKHPDRAEEFTFYDLSAATNNFSLENKIGAGSFGVVYRGKLPDGREVAIKRSEPGAGPKAKKFQEKESAFESEIAFLSRLHHKHLVRLVGYCEEREERLLVYEYMKNGALYDHLHDKNNVGKTDSRLNSWKMRINVSLDAARGIEYLHNYAVPPIIHRDIKSSNILLDESWTARVSDFGLSLLGPDSDSELRRIKAAGTIGYIDPEYYGLNVLTAKSDVYGLGVVLLELLTGKRAIFKSGEGGVPVSVVDFAVPAILAGDLGRILDKRVGLPEINEAEAVELVAYTAMHAVNLEGRDRPTMADIVANLERALALCEGSHGSISSGQISILSD